MVEVMGTWPLPSRDGHFWAGEAFRRMSSILVEYIENVEASESMGANSGESVKSYVDDEGRGNETET